MKLSWMRIPLRLSRPFRTASAYRTHKETVWVQLEHDGIVGWGEAVPVDTYGQSLESAEVALKRIGGMLAGEPYSLETHLRGLLRSFDDQRATICAIDAALHDWLGKRHGLATCRWLGLDPAAAPLTSYSIGIDDRETIEAKVREAGDYPILKVKVGGTTDLETLRLIRSLRPEATIRVDANQAWTADEALARLPGLAELGVEFVEQPVRAADRAGLRRLREAGICPIVADESCVRPLDVVGLAGCVDGINIKLSKCGGIRQGLEMIHLARGLGLKVMLGCMIESSLGIAAAAQLAPLADWIDLDGHLLLSEEPFEGLPCRAGRLEFGGDPGLGVRLR